MKKYKTLFILSALVVSTTTLLGNDTLSKREIFYLTQKKLSTQARFEQCEPDLFDTHIKTDPLTLLSAAENMLEYLWSSKGMRIVDYTMQKCHPEVAQQKGFDAHSMFTRGARKTLEFIIWSIRQDKKLNRPFRVLDPEYLKQHFNFIAWKPDASAATQKGKPLKNPDQIRTTKYAVFKAKGKKRKKGKYCYALYKLPADWKKDSFHLTLSKQEVFAGALEKKPYRKRVKALAWLTEYDFKQAMLQGSINVEFKKGRFKLFNVDKSNKMPMDKKAPGGSKRYWYFKELETDNGNLTVSRNGRLACVLGHDRVALAGDVYNIGLGKIVALESTHRKTGKKEMRLCTLVDYGGAFKDNLYQVDQYAGMFERPQDLYNQTTDLPLQAHAYILVKKGV